MKTIYDSSLFPAFLTVSRLLFLLKLHERYSLAQLQSLQERKLRSLFQHAQREIPYYGNLFQSLSLRPENDNPLSLLKHLPILSKEEARELFRSEFLRNRAMDTEKSLLSVHTTGSTGTPLTVFLSEWEFLTASTFIVYGFLKSGASLRDSYGQIIVPGYQRNHFPFERLGILKQHYIDLREGVEEILRQLKLAKPSVLYSYPSVLSLLARQILSSEGSTYRPGLIVTHGELLTDQTRSLIAQAFGCPVRDSYGAAEAFRIAYECEHQRLHIIADSCVVEADETTLDADGAADLIITPLYLRRVPLIRYRIGDRGILSDDTCPCGSCLPVIRKLFGRCDDFLTLPSGRKISARAVNLLERVPGMIEYQIIQKKRDLFEVIVKPNREFSETTVREIERTISEGCSPEKVHIAVHTVQNVQRAPNGKLNAVLSEAR